MHTCYLPREPLTGVLEGVSYTPILVRGPSKYYDQFQREREAQTHLLIRNIEVNVKMGAKLGRGKSVVLHRTALNLQSADKNDLASLSVPYNLHSSWNTVR